MIALHYALIWRGAISADTSGPIPTDLLTPTKWERVGSPTREEARDAGVFGPWELNDWEEISNLTLVDMQWHERSRETIHGALVVNGTIVVGSFATIDANGQAQTNPSVQASCTLALPATLGVTIDAAVIGAPLEATVAAGLANALTLPNLCCTFEADVPHFWKYVGLNELNAASFGAMMQHCPTDAPSPCASLDDMKFGNFEYFLARKAMMSITLAARLSALHGYPGACIKLSALPPGLPLGYTSHVWPAHASTTTTHRPPSKTSFPRPPRRLTNTPPSDRTGRAFRLEQERRLGVDGRVVRPTRSCRCAGARPSPKPERLHRRSTVELGLRVRVQRGRGRHRGQRDGACRLRNVACGECMGRQRLQRPRRVALLL